MEFPVYTHKTQYYETDQMGVIHHSNYIRWFEEARIFLMEQLGVGYAAMEAEGIMSPVLEVNCEYKSMTRFGETVEIRTSILKYDGIRLWLSYEVWEPSSGQLRCKGSTKHCFMDKASGVLVSLKKSSPLVHQLFQKGID